MPDKEQILFSGNLRYIYSGSPLIRPPLMHRKSGHIRGVGFDEGDKMV
jgi:hypothetical protein